MISSQLACNQSADRPPKAEEVLKDEMTHTHFLFNLTNSRPTWKRHRVGWNTHSRTHIHKHLTQVKGSTLYALLNKKFTHHLCVFVHVNVVCVCVCAHNYKKEKKAAVYKTLSRRRCRGPQMEAAGTQA